MVTVPFLPSPLSRFTSRRFDPPDDPVIFNPHNLLRTLLFPWEHTVPDHDHRSLMITPEVLGGSQASACFISSWCSWCSRWLHVCLCLLRMNLRLLTSRLYCTEVRSRVGDKFVGWRVLVYFCWQKWSMMTEWHTHTHTHSHKKRTHTKNAQLIWLSYIRAHTHSLFLSPQVAVIWVIW